LHTEAGEAREQGGGEKDSRQKPVGLASQHAENDDRAIFPQSPVTARARLNAKETPFAIAQLAALIIFIVFGVLSVRKFHPADG
jgi:hypothetical protein